MGKDEQHYHADAVSAGLFGRCPRCGEGRLFAGFLTVSPSCKTCDLDLSFADSGDGPAVFIILIVGFIVVFLALWVEIAYAPPYWVHAVVFLPLVLLLSFGLLRPMKGLMIALQYRNKAEQGRLDR